jgi:PAS domain S-box-containing protein
MRPQRKRSEGSLSPIGGHSLQLLQRCNVAMVVTHGLKQKNELVNDRFTTLFGYTIEDIPDVDHWWRLAYPEENYRRSIRCEWQARVERAVSSGTDIEPMEATIRCKDGSFRHIEARLSCIGEVSVVTLIDLTRRKQAEDAIKESEERYRRIVETTSEGVWLLDSKFRTAYVNPQMVAMLGYEPAEVVGRSALDFYFPEDVEHKKEVLARRQQGTREQIDERLRRKDGSEVWVRMAANPIVTDTGKFDGALAMVADITERRRVEETLKKSEEKLSKIFRTSPTLINLTNTKSHRYLDVNDAFERVTGYSREEIIGRTTEELGLWADPPRRLELLEQLEKEGAIRDAEFRYRTKAGEIRTGLLSSELLDIDGETYTLTTVSDITERKRAEEALSRVSRAVIEAQEQERARISRELHDDIGQRLALLGNGLQEIQDSSRGLSDEVLSLIGKLQSQTLQIATDVQSLSHELHSSKLELLGLATAMRGFCKEYSEQQRVEIDFNTHDLPGNLPSAIALCLFRILQEALRNAIKHSGVERFEVRSWGTPNEIHLTVGDTGAGFDIEAASKGRGLGLVSMQERLKLIKGTLSIRSQPTLGTIVHARVPYCLDEESVSVSKNG